MPRRARADRVDRRTLVEFLRPRHRGLLVTRYGVGGSARGPEQQRACFSVLLAELVSGVEQPVRGPQARLTK